MVNKESKVIGKPIKYFKESKEELKKVTWPKRKDAVHMTIVVVLISAAVAIFLGFFDFIFSKGLDFLIKR